MIVKAILREYRGEDNVLHVIEKIEGPWAVIEWGRDSFKIPKSILPGNARQGDKVRIEVHLYNDSGRLRRESNNLLVLNDF